MIFREYLLLLMVVLSHQANTADLQRARVQRAAARLLREEEVLVALALLPAKIVSHH